jgi:hypothetical protein
MNIDPDGKLLRKALEIGMTREEAQEWMRNVEALGVADPERITRAMPMAFIMREAQSFGHDPMEHLEGVIQFNKTGVAPEVPHRYPVTTH